MIKISSQFFGGRGSSGRSAGGGGGGSQATPNSAAANQSYQTKLQQVQAMSDTEFESYLDNLRIMNLNLDSSYDYAKNSTFQKMVSDLGVNDKPTVVDKSTFEDILAQNPNAKIVYRGVRDGKDISATEILNQIKYSDGFHVGGGYYGDGLYYTGDVTTARATGKIQRVIIDPKAKVISRDDLKKAYNALPVNTRAALTFAGNKSTGDWYNNGESHLALKLGYDAIQGEQKAHLIILNRKIMIVDKASYSQDGAGKVASKTAQSHRYKDIKDIQ